MRAQYKSPWLTYQMEKTKILMPGKMDYLKGAHDKQSTECGGLMPDEISINERGNIIEVISSGVLTRQDMKGTKPRFQKILAEKPINRIFIDTTRLKSVPSIVEIYEIITSLPVGFKIAILIAPSSPIIREVTFAETVGRNRGTTIKVCLDRDEAWQWLGASKD